VRQQQSSGRSGVVDQGGVFFDGETRQAAGGDDASFASGAFAVGFGEDDPSADEDEVERLPDAKVTEIWSGTEKCAMIYNVLTM